MSQDNQIIKDVMANEASNPEEIMDAIAEIVSTGKCILFLGAGVHCTPPPNSEYIYEKQHQPPLGRAFSATLADQTGFARRFPDEGIGNLQRVAQDYETKNNRSELIRELRTAVDVGRRPSPALLMLADLDFPLVITTNYDQLFEEALRFRGKRPFVSVYKKNEAREETTDDYPFDEDPSPERPFVFKIHGDVGRPESIVITDEDYIQFVLRMSDKLDYHPVPETIRFHFKKWPTLFIGYSLKDYNLRLLFKTLRWKVDRSGFPRAYSVDLYPDPLVFDVWFQQRRYINFLAQDVWTFVPELFRRIKP